MPQLWGVWFMLGWGYETRCQHGTAGRWPNECGQGLALYANTSKSSRKISRSLLYLVGGGAAGEAGAHFTLKPFLSKQGRLNMPET